MHFFLFVYGTLRYYKTRKHALGMIPKGTRAVIKNMQRKYVHYKNQPYPVLIKSKGKRAAGYVIALTHHELHELDEYEDHKLYRRKRVALANGHRAYAYLPKEEIMPKLGRVFKWDNHAS